MSDTSGEVLSDISSTGKMRPWRKHKQASGLLAESYERIGKEKKADRCADCGRVLSFESCPNGHFKKLTGAYFCKDRLCPTCAWRRGLMLAYQLRMIAHIANEQENLKWLFITLTIKNMEGEQLSHELDHLYGSFSRLAQRKVFKELNVGYFRALEVTRNMNKKTESYGTFHPHFHTLQAVSPSYFKKGYMTQPEWTRLWQDCLQVDYTPIVHIQVVKPKGNKVKDFMDRNFEMKNGEIRNRALESAIVETAKYPVKPMSYLVPGDNEMTDDTVRILEAALKNRRLLGFGGLLKTIRNDLKASGKISDVEGENADLIHVEDTPEECTCPTCGSALIEETFRWLSGNYVSQ